MGALFAKLSGQVLGFRGKMCAGNNVNVGVEMDKNITHSAVCDGMNGLVVTIESQFVRGFSGLQMIGNISESLRDSKERARTALEGLGVHVPPKKLIMSITPADVKKSGDQFDLGIAVNLLLLLNSEGKAQVDAARYVYVAELSLAGGLKPVRGIISYAIAAVAEGFTGLVVAKDNLADLAVLRELNNERFADLDICAFEHLHEVRAWLYGEGETLSINSLATREKFSPIACNFNDMILDTNLYRAALCLAIGRHSLIMNGPPGTGKSMFAMRLPSILPPLESQEHLQALRISSAHTVNVDEKLLAGQPPFRSPHHSASAQGVLGTAERPGDIALAHGGILFLDEFPEFRRDIIESLREPLETGEINISRAKNKVRWCAKLILIAAANSCPCGFWGSSKKKCTCPLTRVIAYRRRLSGPIMDRIDIHLNVPENKHDAALLFDLIEHGCEDQTTKMQARVLRCLAFSKKRNNALGLRFNNTIPARQLLAVSGLPATEFRKLLTASYLQKLSKRALIKTLRVARTLADIELQEKISEEHLRSAYSWQSEAAAHERGDFAIGLQ